MYIHIYIHAYIQTHIHTYIQYIRTYIITHTYVHTHTYIYIHTYIHIITMAILFLIHHHWWDCIWFILHIKRFMHFYLNTKSGITTSSIYFMLLLHMEKYKLLKYTVQKLFIFITDFWMLEQKLVSLFVHKNSKHLLIFLILQWTKSFLLDVCKITFIFLFVFNYLKVKIYFL